MKLLILPLALMAIWLNNVQSQVITEPFGAISHMQGGVSVTANDLWTVVNNPSGMCFVPQQSIGLYSVQKYGIRESNLGAVAGFTKFRNFYIGSSIAYFGIPAYNQQRFCLSMSKMLFKEVSVGIQFNYVYTRIADYGSNGNIVGGIGLQSKIRKDTYLSLYFFNPEQRKYSNQNTDPIASFGRLGVKHEVSSVLVLHLEYEIPMQKQASLKAGLNYAIANACKISLGISELPFTYHYGISCTIKKLQIDGAIAMHQILGFTPRLSLTLPIKPNSIP